MSDGELFDPNKRLSMRQLKLMGDLVPEGAEEKDINYQMGLADELRKTDMPTMRGNSRIMVASNPLEFGTTALGRIGGLHMRGGQQDRMTDLAGRIRKKVMDAAAPSPVNQSASQQADPYNPDFWG